MNETRANRFFARNSYPPVPENRAPIIVAVNLKTPENAGHLIRLAANIGCRKVLIVHEDKLYRNTKLKRVAGPAYNLVDWHFCSTGELANHIPPGYTLTALETAPGSQNLFTSPLPQRMALMVGNEQEGLPEWALNKCELLLHIPMSGPVKSMNVSHAASVALGMWLNQWFPRA